MQHKCDTREQNSGPIESWKEWADCDSGVLIGRREAEAGEHLGLAGVTYTLVHTYRVPEPHVRKLEAEDWLL